MREIVTRPCYACGQEFLHDADRVPSLLVEKIRRPICRSCIEKANIDRVAFGMPAVRPLPGAYGEEIPDARREEPAPD